MKILIVVVVTDATHLCQDQLQPLPSQRVVLLTAGIIHGRPVLDVSLTPLPPESTHAMRDTAVGIWFAYFGQVSWGYTTPGLKLAISDSKITRPL